MVTLKKNLLITQAYYFKVILPTEIVGSIALSNPDEKDMMVGNVDDEVTLEGVRFGGIKKWF